MSGLGFYDSLQHNAFPLDAPSWSSGQQRQSINPEESQSGPACARAWTISPLVILWWERMCSLRLMTCLSKRKSPPFSEARPVPTLASHGAQRTKLLCFRPVIVAEDQDLPTQCAAKGKAKSDSHRTGLSQAVPLYQSFANTDVRIHHEFMRNSLQRTCSAKENYQHSGWWCDCETIAAPSLEQLL